MLVHQDQKRDCVTFTTFPLNYLIVIISPLKLLMNYQMPALHNASFYHQGKLIWCC